MAGTALPERLNWQSAAVVELIIETPQAVSVVLELPGFPAYRPGQHVDVRLPAPDANPAQRSYSIASAPEDGYLMLTVERVAGGEVSSYLADRLRPGDSLALRGPIGSSFLWEPSVKGPVLLVAGDAGIVPFRAMLRHRAAVNSPVVVRLLYASRSLEEVIYRDELMRLAAYDEVDIRLTLTRQWPRGWRGHCGQIDDGLLDEISWPARERPLIFVCGPTRFVENIAATILQRDHSPELIRTEPFGPMGS
jgi:ferredoxin-NADP reductase